MYRQELIESGRNYVDRNGRKGDMMLCSTTMQYLFKIPDEHYKITLVLSKTPRKNSYKIINDFNDSSGESFGDYDKDIRVIYSDGTKQFIPMNFGVKTELLKHISMPCYASIELS